MPDRNPSNELVFERVFDAPRELVFAAWTSPVHLPCWYGPHGFTTAVERMDVRSGGSAQLVMRGPDGTRYPDELAYEEVVAPERLVIVHRAHRETAEPSPVEFRQIVTFEDRGARTKMTMRLVFASAEARDANVRTYHSDEGGVQTLERLGAHVGEMSFFTETERPTIVMTRLLDAPRGLVFGVITQPEHLARWWGPRRTQLVTCEVDLRPGGRYRYVLRTPDGRDAPFSGEYREVSLARLVFTQKYEPAPGEAAVITCTLTDVGDKTLLELVQDARSFAQRDAILATGAKSGAVESHDRLAELLGELVVHGRELVLEREFAAPLQRVWDVWTNPEHLARWWGPRGFTTKNWQLELRAGGRASYVMVAPDGSEYPFDGTHVEVVPRERLVTRGVIHGGVEVTTTVAFAARGDKTLVSVRQTFSKETAATRGSRMGWTQQLDRLGKHLAV
ncbi:MAG TPA: SRPBCC domain-containing protein [Kofleriaceae bacterium]|nr:SRPBCC domain-containing protein [Kofleriaceae bacterium]